MTNDMSSNSLFGHLVTKFSVSPENLATESLNYILRSATAREAFVGFLAQVADVDLGEQYTFRTQVGGSDGVVPDLVGFDTRGEQSLIVEAKFWAGLTENQPLAYLDRLPMECPGALVFLVPGRRHTLLWEELLRRCQEDGVDCQMKRTAIKEVRSASLGMERSLVLVSWRRVLAFLEQELRAEGEDAVVADVLQLQGLCERMDTEAFLPITSEELTSRVPWRIIQYGDLIHDVASDLVSENLVSMEGRRETGGYGWFGRILDGDDLFFFLGFNAKRWAEFASTPLWLSIYGPNWTMPSTEVRSALRPLELSEPRRLHVDGDHLVVPLFIPTGVERPKVRVSLVKQVKEVLEMAGHRSVQER